MSQWNKLNVTALLEAQLTADLVHMSQSYLQAAEKTEQRSCDISSL